MRDMDVIADERQKRLFFWMTLSLVFIFLASMLAYGQEEQAALIMPIESTGDIAILLPVLLEAFRNGHWMVFGAGLVMLLTFVAKKYIMPQIKLRPALMPLVALGLSIMASASAELVAGKGLEAAVYILVGGLVSPALYDAIKGVKESKKDE